jgi:hypothetical protein
VLWSCQVPRAPKVPRDTPPKIKAVYGPTRQGSQRRLPEEYGTYWGRNDPRQGKSLIELYPERYQVTQDPPPAYSGVLDLPFGSRPIPALEDLNKHS